MGRCVRRLVRLAGRLRADCRGNMGLIAVGLAGAAVAVGFGLDYGRAVSLRARMAALGHAAAMDAVSRPMTSADDATAQALATSLFTAQARGLAGLRFDPASGLRLVVTDVPGGRQAVVSWNAGYATLFGGLFGAASLPVVGSAVASEAGAANVDFALALAVAQGGAGGGAAGLRQAAGSMVPVARQLAAQNRVIYRMQIVASDAGGLGLAVLSDPLGDVNGLNPGGGAPLALPMGRAGAYGALLTALGATLAAPGDGAPPGGPQSVVVLVTDGSPGMPGADDLAACEAMKARGMVLAALFAAAAANARLVH